MAHHGRTNQQPSATEPWSECFMNWVDDELFIRSRFWKVEGDDSFFYHQIRFTLEGLLGKMFKAAMLQRSLSLLLLPFEERETRLKRTEQSHEVINHVSDSSIFINCVWSIVRSQTSSEAFLKMGFRLIYCHNIRGYTETKGLVLTFPLLHTGLNGRWSMVLWALKTSREKLFQGPRHPRNTTREWERVNGRFWHHTLKLPSTFILVHKSIALRCQYCLFRFLPVLLVVLGGDCSRSRIFILIGTNNLR